MNLPKTELTNEKIDEIERILIKYGHYHDIMADDLAHLIHQAEIKARIDEWKLISEVQHSAGITAELYFGKERDERINQLTTKGNK